MKMMKIGRKEVLNLMDHSDLGSRMKAYENCYRVYLPKRQAVIVRIDGRAFHSFTKGFNRPYDALFASCMWNTTKQLCENISGCVFGYTQSDEISLVLVDYKNINTEPWFGNNLQKIVSISASMATYFFKENFEEAIRDEYLDWYTTGTVNDEKEKLLNQHSQAYNDKLCVFDARAFILPREEVSNYIYWRQLDCVRNSIQLAGQAYFSHKQLQNKNCDQIQEMLWQEHEVNWSKYPTWFKNGVAIYKQPRKIYHQNEDGIQYSVMRDKWTIDLEMSMVSQNPDFINKWVIFD